MDERLCREQEGEHSQQGHARHDQVQLRLRQLRVKHDSAEQVTEDLRACIDTPEEAEVEAFRVCRRTLGEVLPLGHPENRAAEAADYRTHYRKHLNKTNSLEELLGFAMARVLVYREVSPPAGKYLGEDKNKVPSRTNDH